jgi:UrcA family protein
MLKNVFPSLVLAAAVLASTPARAEDRLPDVRVYYGDLDLSRADGIQTLDRRLRHAVEATCASDNGVRELAQLRAIAVCRATKQAELAPRRQSALAATRGGETLAAAR